MVHQNLITKLWPMQDARLGMRYIILAMVGSLLLAISSKISIPFYPVPVTMQTFVVLTLGMVYGWRLGGATILLYLFEGAIGLPVFQGTPEKGLGLAYMVGPTGGYLIGFFMASMVCGFLAERGWDRSVFQTALAMLAGTAVIYIPGVLWLGFLLGWDKPILEWGFLNFVLSDVAKIALAAGIMPLLWRLFKGSKN